MITDFFKQSKPINYIFLGVLLTIIYGIVAYFSSTSYFDWQKIIVIGLKFCVLLLCFVIFDFAVKFFEIQKGHSFYGLLFVLFSAFYVEELLHSNEIYAFLLISLSCTRLLSLINSEQKTLKIFESVFLIFLASLFYDPSIYLLLLVLAGIIIFTTPQWRFFVVPILAISAVIVLVEMFYLITEDRVVNVFFFLPEWTFQLQEIQLNLNVFSYGLWITLVVACIFQMFKVRKKRSLYHKRIALFFMLYLALVFISHWVSISSISGLWLLSIWPICIYLGDFINQINKKTWQHFAFIVIVIMPMLYFIILLGIL